jgi:uncharacterized membrane protein
MPDSSTVMLLFAAALGSGLAGGVFFAFSGFVMQGLALLPGTEGPKAMNAINVTAVKPPLMILLFGTAVLCAFVVVLGFFRFGIAGMPMAIVAALVYLAGAIAITMLRNVPLNIALAKDAGNADLWARYLKEWVWWNHVRTAACAVASALFIAALIH